MSFIVAHFLSLSWFVRNQPMQVSTRAVVGCVLLSAVVVLAGCGESVDHPPVYPASGTVTYNGEPVVGAKVSFMGENASKEASGITGLKGEFRLRTYVFNDGAVAGVHKVMVSKSDPSLAATSASMDQMMNDPAAMAAQSEAVVAKAEAGDAKPLIPLKYASPESTPLSETVSDSKENVFDIKLTD
jgi:hypothetical protein